LNALDRKEKQLSLNVHQTKATDELADGSNIKFPSILMLLFFLVATSFTIGTGFFL
jgi:hypothetical protein